MPELPEVEVTRRGLLQDLSGAVVERVWTSGLPLRATVSLQRLRRHLESGQFHTVAVIYITPTGSPKRRCFTTKDLQAIRQRICFSM